MKKLSIVIAVSALIFGFIGCGSTPKQDPVMPVQKAPENEIDKAAKILSEEMENACQMKVRLRADVNTGKTWYDAKD